MAKEEIAKLRAADREQQAKVAAARMPADPQAREALGLDVPDQPSAEPVEDAGAEGVD